MAATGIDLEAAQYQRPQPAGHPRLRSGRGDLLGLLGPTDGLEVFAGKGSDAIQSLVEADTIGILIAALVCVGPQMLLGRHVRGRAHDLAESGIVVADGNDRAILDPGATTRRGLRSRVTGHGLPIGQTKVENPSPPVVTQQHIVRFEIPMDNACGMCAR